MTAALYLRRLKGVHSALEKTTTRHDPVTGGHCCCVPNNKKKAADRAAIPHKWLPYNNVNLTPRHPSGIVVLKTDPPPRPHRFHRRRLPRPLPPRRLPPRPTRRPGRRAPRRPLPVGRRPRPACVIFYRTAAAKGKACSFGWVNPRPACAQACCAGERVWMRIRLGVFVPAARAPLASAASDKTVAAFCLPTQNPKGSGSPTTDAAHAGRSDTLYAYPGTRQPCRVTRVTCRLSCVMSCAKKKQVAPYDEYHKPILSLTSEQTREIAIPVVSSKIGYFLETSSFRTWSQKILRCTKVQVHTVLVCSRNFYERHLSALHFAHFRNKQTPQVLPGTCSRNDAGLWLVSDRGGLRCLDAAVPIRMRSDTSSTVACMSASDCKRSAICLCLSFCTTCTSFFCASSDTSSSSSFSIVICSSAPPAPQRARQQHRDVTRWDKTGEKQARGGKLHRNREVSKRHIQHGQYHT